MAISVIALNTSIAQKAKFVTSEDSLSYALGVANYGYYVKDSINVNARMFAKGMTDAAGSKAVMSDSLATEFIMTYLQKRETAMRLKEYAAQIEAGKKYLAENAGKEGVITLPSGLQYRIITKGDGAKPGPEDIVVVHYTGTTISGDKFDSSLDRNEPARFRVNNVIKGWVEGLQQMNAGSKFMLYIPSDLAYGERGAGGVIKPYETLVFEVELLEVIKEGEEERQ